MVAINPVEAAVTSVSLMTLVTGAAASARAAQELMSTPVLPMGIERFRVKFNLACSINLASETDIGFSVFGANVKEHLKFSIEDKMGFGIDFTLKQQGLIVAEIEQGRTIAGEDYQGAQFADGNSR